MNFEIEESFTVGFPFDEDVAPEKGRYTKHSRWSILLQTSEVPKECSLALADKFHRLVKGNKDSILFLGVVGQGAPPTKLYSRWSFWHILRNEIHMVPKGKPHNGLFSIGDGIGHYTIYEPADSLELCELLTVAQSCRCVFVRCPLGEIDTCKATLEDKIEKKSFSEPCLQNLKATCTIVDLLLDTGYCIITSTGGEDTGIIALDFWQN